MKWKDSHTTPVYLKCGFIPVGRYVIHNVPHHFLSIILHVAYEAPERSAMLHEHTACLGEGLVPLLQHGHGSVVI